MHHLEHFIGSSQTKAVKLLLLQKKKNTKI
ncbi:uncharacterized protein METZ01_LOCUS427154 [marine metagenome]|uniref:Uncharacterized protein n=1 Tax=marine metagenome TaxID=408172 RepID=A0A382XTY6_9ZZZZ